MTTLRQIMFGPPLPTHRAAEERLSNFRALAVLSPDALASIAYANQEIFLGLVVAGAAGLAYSGTVALAIALLLVIVALSYMQIISAYPGGGGSYTVARENLGVNAGLVAAAGLSLSYLLNVAVSMTAGAALSTAYVRQDAGDHRHSNAFEEVSLGAVPAHFLSRVFSRALWVGREAGIPRRRIPVTDVDARDRLSRFDVDRDQGMWAVLRV